MYFWAFIQENEKKTNKQLTGKDTFTPHVHCSIIYNMTFKFLKWYWSGFRSMSLLGLYDIFLIIRLTLLFLVVRLHGWCHYHDIVLYQSYVLSIRFVIIDADFNGLASGDLSGLCTLKFSTPFPCYSLCKEVIIWNSHLRSEEYAPANCGWSIYRNYLELFSTEGFHILPYLFIFITISSWIFVLCIGI